MLFYGISWRKGRILAGGGGRGWGLGLGAEVYLRGGLCTLGSGTGTGTETGTWHANAKCFTCVPVRHSEKIYIPKLHILIFIHKLRKITLFT